MDFLLPVCKDFRVSAKKQNSWVILYTTIHFQCNTLKYIFSVLDIANILLKLLNFYTSTLELLHLNISTADCCFPSYSPGPGILRLFKFLLF